MMRPPGFHRAIVVIALIAVTGVVAISVASVAGAFSDVSNSHPFHDEISAMADAGITTGYEDGTYRPGVAVNRGSMAAFLGRGLTRAGYDEGSSSVASAAFQTLGEVDMERGASVGSGDAGQYVVTATVEVATTGVTSHCPCTVTALVNGPGSNDEQVVGVLGVPPDNSGRARESLTLHAVFPAGPDLPGPEFTLQAGAFRNSGSGEPTYDFTGSLSVLYVPFGFDGTQALTAP
jgi:hypothetical protein